MNHTPIACTIALLFSLPAAACPGTFIRDSQNYDNRSADGSLETIEGVVRKGTRDEIVGYAIVEGRKYYIQLHAYLHAPADIRLAPGCKLKPYG